MILPYLVYAVLLLLGAGVFRAWHTGRLTDRAAKTALCVLGVAMTVWLLLMSEPGLLLSDFKKAYLAAGRHVIEDRSQLYPAPGQLRFVNLPILAYLFTPFTWVPPRMAGWIMFGLGLLSLPAIIVLLNRLTGASGKRRWLIAALVLGNGPLMNCVREGNTTNFVLIALLVAFLAAARDKQFRMGFWMAVAALIKLPLLLMGLWLPARRLWRAAIAFWLTVGAVGLGSVLMFGIELNTLWYERCVAPFSKHPMAAFNVQSIDGLLARFLVPGDHLIDWVPIEEPGAMFAFFNPAAKGLLALLTAWHMARPRANAPQSRLLLEGGLLLCLSLLFSPLSWSHYYLLLLLPMGLFASGALHAGASSDRINLLFLAGVLISLPVVHAPIPQNLLGLWVETVWFSHYVFGGLLLLGLLLAAYGWAGPGSSFRSSSER